MRRNYPKTILHSAAHIPGKLSGFCSATYLKIRFVTRNQPSLSGVCSSKLEEGPEVVPNTCVFAVMNSLHNLRINRSFVHSAKKAMYGLGIKATFVNRLYGYVYTAKSVGFKETTFCLFTLSTSLTKETNLNKG